MLRVMTKREKQSPRPRVLPAKALVSVVDDDESVRESLPDLLREFGFAAQAFASADEFEPARGCPRTTTSEWWPGWGPHLTHLKQLILNQYVTFM